MGGNESDEQRKVAGFWTLGPASPHPLLLMGRATAAEHLAVARTQAEQYAALPPAPRPGARGGAGNRLRIGYLSGDLRDHPVGAVTAGVFEAHDRDRFEVIAYDYSAPDASELRGRIARAFERFVCLRALSYADAARRIADDACDVVVDLAGWTAGTRSPILAARPAPTQVQWLGFAGTMGAPWIDYIVADPVVAPVGEEAAFAEKIIRLPHSYSPTDDRLALGSAPSRKAEMRPATNASPAPVGSSTSTSANSNSSLPPLHASRSPTSGTARATNRGPAPPPGRPW